MRPAASPHAGSSRLAGAASARPPAGRRRRRAAGGGSPPRARRIDDLVAGQIGHVEDVDGPLAEGRDMGRGDVEVEVGDRPGQVVEQAGRSRPEASMTVNCSSSALSTMMLVSSVKALSRALLLALAARPCSGRRMRAGERLLDQVADLAGAALLVGVVVELAADRDRVERLAVGGREDLRVDDIGAGDGAGAGDERQEPRMVGREDGDLGDRLEGPGPDRGGERRLPPRRPRG